MPSEGKPKRKRSRGSVMLDAEMERQGLIAKQVAERLSPRPDPTTITRWRAGTREPQHRSHRVQMRELFGIPETAWQSERIERKREAWLAKHPPAKPDPKQLELPTGVTP